MQSQVARPNPEDNLIEFRPIRDPEISYLKSYQMLVMKGIRQDIAHSLASYTTFRGEAFDPNSNMLVKLNEEIGQEPAVQGRMAA